MWRASESAYETNEEMIKENFFIVFNFVGDFIDVGINEIHKIL